MCCKQHIILEFWHWLMQFIAINLLYALFHLVHNKWYHKVAGEVFKQATDGRFGSKECQIGPKLDKSGAFQFRFQCIWRPAPNALKFNLKKPGFVPFGANLTHFGAKPTIPETSSEMFVKPLVSQGRQIWHPNWVRLALNRGKSATF